jgi:hypothetical protein
MTDTPNEHAPATRSEWLALIREAVRLEMVAKRAPREMQGDPRKHVWATVTTDPQPPSEG